MGSQYELIRLPKIRRAWMSEQTYLLAILILMWMKSCYMILLVHLELLLQILRS